VRKGEIGDVNVVVAKEVDSFRRNAAEETSASGNNVSVREDNALGVTCFGV
jgi:hypothetical protein